MRLLITGLSGFIGTSIISDLLEKHEVYSFCRSSSGKKGVTEIKGDLLDAGSIYRAVKEIKPDGIILMGAISSLYEVGKNPLTGYLTNTQSVEHFIRAAKSLGLESPPQIIFFSTDLVYDGYDVENPSGFSESDPPKQKTRYGRTKLEAEHLLSFYQNSLVLRVSLTYEEPEQNKRLSYRGYLGSLVKSIQNGETINLFKDEWRTPIEVSIIGQALLQLMTIKAKLPPVLNLSGSERLSRDEFGRRLINKLSPNFKGIKPILREESSAGRIRGKDCSLNNDALKRIIKLD